MQKHLFLRSGECCKNEAGKKRVTDEGVASYMHRIFRESWEVPVRRVLNKVRKQALGRSIQDEKQSGRDNSKCKDRRQENLK